MAVSLPTPVSNHPPYYITLIHRYATAQTKPLRRKLIFASQFGTVRADRLRLLLSLAAEDDLDLVSHDIKTAFLYPDSKFNIDIYLLRPNGGTDDIMPAIVQP